MEDSAATPKTLRSEWMMVYTESQREESVGGGFAGRGLGNLAGRNWRDWTSRTPTLNSKLTLTSIKPVHFITYFHSRTMVHDCTVYNTPQADALVLSSAVKEMERLLSGPMPFHPTPDDFTSALPFLQAHFGPQNHLSPHVPVTWPRILRGRRYATRAVSLSRSPLLLTATPQERYCSAATPSVLSATCGYLEGYCVRVALAHTHTARCLLRTRLRNI